VHWVFFLGGGGSLLTILLHEAKSILRSYLVLS
jgi:hypothetical protein